MITQALTVFSHRPIRAGLSGNQFAPCGLHGIDASFVELVRHHGQVRMIGGLQAVQPPKQESTQHAHHQTGAMQSVSPVMFVQDLCAPQASAMTMVMRLKCWAEVRTYVT